MAIRSPANVKAQPVFKQIVVSSVSDNTHFSINFITSTRLVMLHMKTQIHTYKEIVNKSENIVYLSCITHILESKIVLNSSRNK